jgi:hypothetical protein
LNTNFGDDGNNLSLELAGSNIPVTAGNYTIVANFTTKTYTTRLTNAVGIIETQLQQDGVQTPLWIIIPRLKIFYHCKMNAGQFKFRLNRDWGTNDYDNGNNLSLDSGGDNIAVKTGIIISRLILMD